jgi:hypothetical protein
VVAGVADALADEEGGEGLTGVVAAEKLVDHGERAGQVCCLRDGQDEAGPARRSRILSLMRATPAPRSSASRSAWFSG